MAIALQRGFAGSAAPSQEKTKLPVRKSREVNSALSCGGVSVECPQQADRPLTSVEFSWRLVSTELMGAGEG